MAWHWSLTPSTVRLRSNCAVIHLFACGNCLLHPRYTADSRPYCVLRAGIYSNHQIDKRGNLTLAGFLSCVYEQTVENEAAIVWELQQLGYGSREAGSRSAGPAAATAASTSAAKVAAADLTSTPPSVAAPAPAPAPAPAKTEEDEASGAEVASPALAPAPAPASAPPPATDTSATRSKTKSALLGGLRSGKLEEAVAKMEEDEAAAAETGEPAPAVFAGEERDDDERREDEEEDDEEEEEDGKFGFERGSDEDFEFD